MAAEGRYIIAVRRDQQAGVPPNWVEIVRSTSGVTVMGTSNATRVQVQATSEAITQLGERLGAWVHIEPAIWHYPT